MEVDKIYQYSKRPLAAPEVTLLPLVNFTDYYEFIHEKLLPEYGYANIGENSIFLEYQNGYQNENWDRRDGILDAAIKDLNGDEVEDLLVFRFGHWDGDPMEDDALGNQEGRRIILEGENRLIAELYSMDENGEIFLAGRTGLRQLFRPYGRVARSRNHGNRRNDLSVYRELFECSVCKWFLSGL